MKLPSASVVLQQVRSGLAEISWFAKVVAGFSVLFYLLSFVSAVQDYAAVVPGYLMPPNGWIWTLGTFVFVHTSWWELLIELTVLLFSDKLLSPVWGSFEMLLFFALTNAVSVLLCALAYVFAYFATGDDTLLFGAYLHGFAAYVGGVTVAVRQSMPDNVLLNLGGAAKLRNRHIPLLTLVFVALLRVISGGLFATHVVVLFALGIYVGWIYLRFYQRHGAARGDMADSFSFAGFFPNHLNPPIAIISNTIFMALVYLRICKRAPPRRADAGSSMTHGLPVTDPDAERRRQVALRALQERMTKLELQGTANASGWPTLLDADREREQRGAVMSGSTTPSDVTQLSVAVNMDGSATAAAASGRSLSNEIVTVAQMHPVPQSASPASPLN